MITTDDFARTIELAWAHARPGHQATDRDELFRAMHRLLETVSGFNARQEPTERRSARPGVG
jgi:hypothetical protein